MRYNIAINMKKTNQEIAKLFLDMALYYEMLDIAFKPAAYKRAAQVIESLDQEVVDILNKDGEKGLIEIPGVGSGIAGHIKEIAQTGTFKEYQSLRRKIPVNLDELSKIQGVGPKSIKILYKKLGVKNLRDLERAARSGKIAKLPHFGKKSEEKILKGIEFQKQNQGRFLLGYIEPTVRGLEEKIKKISGVHRVMTCGSYRRRQETVGDIDLQVAAQNPKNIIEAFIKFPEVEYIYGSGETKASVRLHEGINCDLRVVPDKSYGAALQYFTGDKAHNIDIRKLAIKKGYKLNEYGLFKGAKMVAGKTEEEIYEKLGMKCMPPELRVANGEIEAAQKNKLPNLIPYGSIQGDLQIQTNWTDGENSILEMALAAQKSGLKYIAITDHTKALAMTGGLDEKKLATQGREIDKINKKLKDFKILKSSEVDVLKDGRLNLADSALKKLDLVCCAVHSGFGMSEDEITNRIIRALKHPLVNIFFHPTGRLIGQREPYKINIPKLLRVAKEFGVALEVDAFPDRLDLRDIIIRDAIKLGVKLVVDTDAHAIRHLQYLNLGVAHVRRGWGEKKDVLNTLPVGQFLKRIKKLKHA